jgi:hypothetical protein
MGTLTTIPSRLSRPIQGMRRSQGRAAYEPWGWVARFRGNLPDVFIFGALLVAGWKYTSGFHAIVDIGLDDETVYLTQGIDFLHFALPLADSAPLYAVWYSLLARVSPDAVALYYLNYRMMTIIPPILFYILLRRYRVSLPVSSFAALFLLITNANFLVLPKVNHFALMVLLVFLILASIPKSRALGFAILALGCLAAAYVRPEMYYAFGICFAISAGLFLFRERALLNATALASLAVIAVAVGMYVGYPLGASPRSFIAFGQHFSLNWQGWTKDTSLSPWTDWQKIVEMNFGQVSGIGQALLNNPPVFGRHVATNAINLPGMFVSTFATHAVVFLPFRMQTVEAYIMLGLGIGWLLLRRRTVLPRMRAAMRTERRFLLFACAICPVFLVTCLVIYPRTHYMLILGTLLLAVMAILLDPLKDRQVRWPHTILIALVVVAITPNAVNLVGPLPRPQPTVNAIQFMRGLGITDETYFLSEQFGYSSYLARDFRADPGAAWRAFTGSQKDIPFNRFLREHRINIIFVTDDLLNNIRFREDPEWKAFLEHYESAGFVKLILPDGRRALYVDKTILPPAK